MRIQVLSDLHLEAGWSPRSLSPDWEGDLMCAAFASDLSPLIGRHTPAVWIHGHVHTARDYRLGPTRVRCNAAGSPGEVTGWDPACCIEVG